MLLLVVRKSVWLKACLRKRNIVLLLKPLQLISKRMVRT